MRTILRLVVPRIIGVVDQDDALALEQIAHRVQLQLHPKIAHPLLRLNERAPHVVVADEPEVEGDPTLRRVSQGRRHAGVGNRHDQVGVDRRLARQAASHLLPAGLHPAAKDPAVGPGEVHMLEDAACLPHAGCILHRGDALAGHHHHFAWPHVALVLGAQQIKGAGLRGEDHRVRTIGIADAAHGERPEAIADRGRQRCGRASS